VLAGIARDPLFTAPAAQHPRSTAIVNALAVPPPVNLAPGWAA
jgi:hypothetical protein